MDDASDRYLDHLRVERFLSPRTIEAYARDIRGLRESLAAEGINRPTDVAAVHVSRWLRSLADRGLAPSSQARALSAIRRFFAYCVREGGVPSNPALEIRGPRLRRRLPVVLSRADMRRLVKHRTAKPRGANGIAPPSS